MTTTLFIGVSGNKKVRVNVPGDLRDRILSPGDHAVFYIHSDQKLDISEYGDFIQQPQAEFVDKESANGSRSG